jgi:aminoglycoside phosphotransferase (APT) family kinase protein
MEGQPLAGGTMSRVQRAGDTVRRGVGPWTPTVHRLLEHVRARGVACHNDLAPYNMVFDAGHRFVGVIDFDTCSPGPRAWDLAYLAYRMVPFHAPGTMQTPAMDGAQRAARLELVCDAYGPPVRPRGVLAVLHDRVRDLYELTVSRAAEAGSNSELHRHLPACEVDLAYLTDLTDLTDLTAEA